MERASTLHVSTLTDLLISANVLFSDECKIMIYGNDGIKYTEEKKNAMRSAALQHAH